MDMKKTYNVPKTIVYKVNVTSHLMEPSLKGDGTGTVDLGDSPVEDSEFDLAGREDNNGGNSIWDNAW